MKHRELDTLFDVKPFTASCNIRWTYFGESEHFQMLPRYEMKMYYSNVMGFFIIDIPDDSIGAFIKKFTILIDYIELRR